MYPNMMQPIPYKKHKSKHPGAGNTQEKPANTTEKNEETEQKKDEKNVEDTQNQIQEEIKQEQ